MPETQAPATGGDPWMGVNPLDPRFKNDPYEPCEFGGKTIPRDAQVWTMLAAGNRDPEAG